MSELMDVMFFFVFLQWATLRLKRSHGTVGGHFGDGEGCKCGGGMGLFLFFLCVFLKAETIDIDTYKSSHLTSRRSIALK